jgi:hypothetical protein
MIDVLLLAAALATPAAECVPARWPSTDPKTLALLEGTPVNCLVLDEAQWANKEFVEAARQRNLTLFAPCDSAECAAAALQKGREAVVFAPRSKMQFDTQGGILATSQGLWPGIHIEKDGATVAAPTGAPWIDTNTGFLRFARAQAGPGKTIWIDVRPPSDRVMTGENFIQAIGDAAMSGARWVLSITPSFLNDVVEARPKAVEEWKRVKQALSFYESNRRYWQLPAAGQVGLVIDAPTGALLSGGLVDMFASRQTPVVPLPPAKLAPERLGGLKMLINVDPSLLEAAQNEALREAARRGARLLLGPPGWKLEPPKEGQITFAKEQVATVDSMWKEINSAIGRSNQGVRLFNAGGLLSSLAATPDGKTAALHVVNYTSYPVESLTVYALGQYKSVRWLTPQGERKPETFEVDEGTGVTIDRIVDVGMLVMER